MGRCESITPMMLGQFHFLIALMTTINEVQIHFQFLIKFITQIICGPYVRKIKSPFVVPPHAILFSSNLPRRSMASYLCGWIFIFYLINRKEMIWFSLLPKQNTIFYERRRQRNQLLICTSKILQQIYVA